MPITSISFDKTSILRVNASLFFAHPRFRTVEEVKKQGEAEIAKKAAVAESQVWLVVCIFTR